MVDKQGNQTTCTGVKGFNLPDDLGSDYPALAGLQMSDVDFVIPLMREELEFQKQPVVRGVVRLTKIVRETPETIDELLTSEHIEVERVPRDQILAASPSVRMEGEVMVVPVVEEVLVVTKQLRLKEELRITKKRTMNEHHQEVMLRTEELVVERLRDNGSNNESNE